jgi:uncharacterized membrane-anchored protein
MDRKQFLLIMVVPLIVIVGFMGVKLYTVYAGEEILLKVAPVDPRDMFRGDYIALSYDISRINLATVPYDSTFSSGETIYAVLSRKEKYWTIDSVSHAKSSLGENQVFMKGRVIAVSGQSVRVEWGIESYFVPEGEGLTIERMRDAELSVIVVVDNTGSSVLKQLLINDEPV